MLEIEVHGVRLCLLPQRAAWLPDHGTLLVADAHLGKAVSFRKLGVPVPEATTEANLDRLSQVIERTGAQRLVFLGDLLHSTRARADGTVEAVSRWRAGHAEVSMDLVPGNHDRHAGAPPPAWNIQLLPGPFAVAGLWLCHEPDPVPDRFALGGHLHPCAVLGGRAHDRLRLPCFHFGARVGVLPAFGAFTGMHVMPRAPGDRVYVVADDEVHALP